MASTKKTNADRVSALAIPLSQDVWDSTSSEARTLIIFLLEQVQSLQKRLEALEERLGSNSGNSSNPPSTDPPGTLRNRKGKSGKSQGGQPGHTGHHRAAMPTEAVDHVLKHFPSRCANCSRELTSENAVAGLDPVRHQVWELPPVQAEVTEHQRYRCFCPDCNEENQALLPVDVPVGAFGPRLAAMVGLLVGQYRLSRRQCESLLRDGFGVTVSLGGIKALESLISTSLAVPVEEVHSAIKQSPVVNADDTGWKEANEKAVLWNVNTPDLAFFQITKKKDHGSARTLLGETFDGILGVDRAKTYSFQDVGKLQSCWAHLDRHFQRMEDREGESADIGRAGKAEVDCFFSAWHNFKNGVFSRLELQREIRPIHGRLTHLLGRGIRCGGFGSDKTLHAKTSRTCENILDVLPALFTCCFHDRVEPTNNSSERALRHPVQWRKTSFGSRSDTGSRFVERILSTIETCRRQGRNVLEFLTQSVMASVQGSPGPSLVPRPS